MRRTLPTHDDVEALRRRIHLRAEWLQDMPAGERERLREMPLREVDRRFSAWLDARAPVGDDGGA